MNRLIPEALVSFIDVLSSNYEQSVPEEILTEHSRLITCIERNIILSTLLIGRFRLYVSICVF